MFFFILLLLFRVVFSWFPVAGWDSLFLDICLVASVILLIKKTQIARALEAWHFLRFRRHEKMRRQFTLAVASDILKMISLPFVVLWFWRWVESWPDVFIRSPNPREITHLDVFIFTLGLSLILDTERLRQILIRAQMTSGRQMLIHYGIAIITGTILLLLPISLQDHQSLTLIDALFVTVSALSVTGLSPINVAEVFSMAGMGVLLVLIQLGGLGIVLITTGFSVATFRRLSLNSILLGREMYGSCRVGDIPNFLARVVALTFTIEAIGAVIIYFALPPDTPQKLFVAVFHSVSSFCHAGFSTFPEGIQGAFFNGVSLTTVSVLVVLGGMGFPIILDMLTSLRRRRSDLHFISPHTKLTLYVMFFLLITGAVMFFVFESIRPTAPLSVMERLGQAIFYSISSRTAGFGLVPVDMFHMSALFWLMLLMVVGANPASTGGGIKTTTVGVLLLAVYHTIRGSRQTTFSGRAIPTIVIARALTAVTLYMLVAGGAITLLVMIESSSPFAIGFEVVSALSTVGLSMGITSQFSGLGKIILMFLMLFGRIGILSILLAGMGNASRSKVRLPEDDFFVG